MIIRVSINVLFMRDGAYKSPASDHEWATLDQVSVETGNLTPDMKRDLREASRRRLNIVYTTSAAHYEGNLALRFAA